MILPVQQVRSEPLAIGRGITPPLKGGAGGGRPPAHPPVLADAGLDALPAASLPLELVVPLLPLLLLLLLPPLLLPLGLVVLLPLRLLPFLSRGTVYNGPWENPSRSGEA